MWNRRTHRRCCMRRMTPILKLITFNNKNVLLACPITVAFISFICLFRSSQIALWIYHLFSSTQRTMGGQTTTSGRQNNVFLFSIWLTLLLLLLPTTALGLRCGFRVKNLRICTNGVLLRWQWLHWHKPSQRYAPLSWSRIHLDAISLPETQLDSY